MNVLLVTAIDQPFGGVASVVGNLGHELEQRGHRVVFFFPGHEEVPTRRVTTQGFPGYSHNLRAPFLPVTPLRSRIAFWVMLARTLLRLRAMLRDERIDLVNIHYPVEQFVYFAFLRLLFGVPVVVSVHGTDVFPIEPGRSVSWGVTLLLECADAIVAPSRSFLDDCARGYPVARRRGLAIHNGVDFDELTALAGNGARPDTPRAPYLLCVAAHNRKKAIDVLLRAFVRIRHARPGMRLVLVGDGPLRPELERLARELAISDHVDFLGERSRSEIGRLFRDCRVFVLPSRAEPFGIVVVEALAHRRPVVAASVGGVPEIIEHGKSGILVEPDNPDALADAVLRVLRDETLSQAISATGQTRVHEQFGRHVMGGRYERVFRDLLLSSESGHGGTF